MARLTLQDLTRIMRESAGVEEGVDLSGDIGDVAFADLGYDSLAVLELAARAGRELGVEVPDEAAEHMPTPNAALAYLNGLAGDASDDDEPRIGHTVNAIVINAPLDLVWEMTNDVERWPQLFTEYAAAEILERDGDTIRFRLTMHPDEQGNAWSWVSERTPDRDSLTVRAHRVERGWFEHMDIFWRYRELDGGVEMRWVQDFKLRDDAPVDDAAMTERLNTNTPVQMAHIRDVVERAAAEGAAGVASA